jgi:hypothetical protein
MIFHASWAAQRNEPRRVSLPQQRAKALISKGNCPFHEGAERAQRPCASSSFDATHDPVSLFELHRAGFFASLVILNSVPASMIDDDRPSLEDLFPTPRECLRLLPLYFAVAALILVPLWLRERARDDASAAAPIVQPVRLAP